MAQVLPIEPSVPVQTFACTLDGVQYRFRARWNVRTSAWYLDIAQDDGTAIRHGIKVVLASALGRRSVDPEFPAGFLYAVDTSGADVEATLDDIGVEQRVQVVFFTFAEMGFADPSG